MRLPRGPKLMLAGLVGLAILLSPVVVSGCAIGDEGLLIGSTNFTESRILANMYAVALEHRGLTAQVKELTTRQIVEPAVEDDQLQITPDYLSTFTEYLNVKANGPSAPPVSSSNVAKTLAAARELATPRGLTVLTPSRAADQNAFAVTAQYAATNKLVTLSQLGTFSQSNAVILGAGPDCPTAPFCEPGLEQTYGIKFASFLALDTGGPLTVQALLQNQIQLGLVFTSQGSIAANNLVVLDDDKHLQAADNIIPVVNTSALTPEIASTLNAISAKLTTKDLQQLNNAVDLQRQDPADVARTWLQANSLI